jgi:drug/metabolite transporter (DMT)-like permease
VIAIAASVALLGEPITVLMLAGALICMGGVALTQAGSARSAGATPSPPSDGQKGM